MDEQRTINTARHTVVSAARAQPLGVGGPDPPNFLEDPQLLTQRFCRGGVHRQASRVNSVYNAEEKRKKKFFLLLLQVLSAFYRASATDPRVLTRYIDIAILSVRPYVTSRYWMKTA